MANFSYNSKKKKTNPLQTIITPYVHRRFILYKALSTPQTLTGKGGNWGADKLQSDLPKVTRPAGG